jgi:predicted Na+-dependent transporter
MAEIDLSFIKDIKFTLYSGTVILILNHIIFGITILTPAYFIFKSEQSLWTGFVLVAVSAPGVGIIPFTKILGGDMKLSVSSVFIGFCMSMIIAPLTISLLVDSSVVSPWFIGKTIIKLVVIPLIIGRLLCLFKLQEYALKSHKYVVNIGFAVIFAIIVGVNRNLMFEHPEYVFKTGLLVAIHFTVLIIIYRTVLSKLKKQISDKVSLFLMGMIKNTIFAATVGLMLTDTSAAIPGLMSTAAVIVFFMLVERIVPKFSDFIVVKKYLLSYNMP